MLTKEIFVVKCDIEIMFWNDAKINGVKDVNFHVSKGVGSPLMPCATQVLKKPTNYVCSNHWRWRPEINIENGQITNWQIGTTADVHYKVCDGFACSLIGKANKVIQKFEGYVPSFMCPSDNGFGDYIIMSIDKDGFIINWNANQVKKFFDSEFC